MTTAYADASAIVKLIVEEPDSAALVGFIREFDDVVTSRVGVVETRRAAARRGGADAMAATVSQAIGVIELDEAIADSAARLEPATLRTLDSLHIASALALDRVDAFVTYDARLASAAQAAGLPVFSPS
jgi:predicted nucleic acid-binding protein